jgi:hypothetical protein
MKREVAVSIVVIALLLVAGLILFTNQSSTLTDARATVTAQADALDTQAADSAQVASIATQAAEANTDAATAGAATQSALEDDMATNQAEAEATATRAAEDQAVLAEDADATQGALEDEIATNQAASTDAAGAQSTLEADLSTRQAEATQLHITATQYVILRVEAATQAAATASSLESRAEALEVQVDELGELATQSVAVSANQSAEVVLAATAQAESAATITALQDDLATALSQAPVTAPTQAVTAPPPTVTSSSATPIATVAVGSLTYDEPFNQDTPWSLGPVEGAGTIDLTNGQYVVTVDVTPSVITAFSLPTVTDAYAEVEVFLDGCPEDGFFGILSRVQPFGEGGYLFLLPCNLSFWAIVVFPTDGQPSVLASDALAPLPQAASHVIGVLTEGDSFTLYFDGELLGSASDNTFPDGMIGLYAESVSAASVLRVDNYRVWELP